MKPETFALDRASVRSIDQDGHMHVALTNISKAAVNEYLGREIPEWQELGLIADKRYALLRDPKELEAAADSFNGKPLLLHHKPVTADDHDHDLTVGSVTNAVWDAPYLKAALDIWAGEAIKAIETGAQKQLSSGYRYRAEMTPGIYEGRRYDGVMKDIGGNHVALVKEGRAGPDVVVGDSALPKLKDLFMATKTAVPSRAAAMAQGALMTYLRPKLAQDAKIDLAPALKGVTAKNYKAKSAGIAAAIDAAVKGKLAADASVEDVQEVLEALADILPEEAEAVAAEVTPDPAGEGNVTDDSDDGDAKAFLASKGLSEEEIAKVIAMLGSSEPAAPAVDKQAQDKNMVTKPAMDAAIAAAVLVATDSATRVQREIRDAEKAVRPWVGDIAIACDSASDVYRAALKVLKVDGADKLHSDALFPILQVQPKPGDTPARVSVSFAQDASATADFDKMFPNANRLK